MRKRDLIKQILPKALFAFAVLTMVSCQDQGPEYIEDLDLVTTTPNEEFDFGAVQYYTMPDSVMYISDKMDEFNGIGTHSELMLSKVRENLDALGYVEITDESTEEADITILISAFDTKYVGYYYWDNWYYWDYWQWYWGPIYPGPFNPIYPAPGYIYTYDVGTVIIDMVDMHTITVDQLPIAWEASINGLLAGDSDDIEVRVSTYIDQAFDQSPYLGNLTGSN